MTTNIGTTSGETAHASAAFEPPVIGQPEARGRRSRGWFRALSAWLVVLLLVAGSVVGGRALVRQRQEPPASLAVADVLLVAEPVPVGPGDAVSSAVVSAVVVREGQRVAVGQRLATVRFAEVLRGDRTIPAHTKWLFAPKDAVVVSVDRTPGAVVRPGEQVLSLYFPDELAFHAAVSIADLDSLRVGMSATVEGPGLLSPVPATVSRVMPELGDVPDSGRVLVALVPHDAADVERLVPGLPFEATVDLTSAPPGAPAVTDTGA